MITLYRPLRSLREGNWFKLICGASFQHLPAIRNLALAYALAGADCIDVAADPAVVAAALEGIQSAKSLLGDARIRGFGAAKLPWVMVSLNDGEDPHFRKAKFDATACPSDCRRPCELICPAQAIVLDSHSGYLSGGVLSDRCYGCGRCLPVCPIQHIQTQSYITPPATLMPLMLAGVDAVEIHTQIGRFDAFRQVWDAIAPFSHQLKLVAISCQDGDGLIDYLGALCDVVSPLPCPLIWQTDGRPMSGDIGDGTTHAAIRLSQKVLDAGLPGYVQLAGGTNHHTVPKLKQLGMLNLGGRNVGSSWRSLESAHHSLRPIDNQTETVSPLSYLSQDESKSDNSSQQISGVAYGSFARALLSPVLEKLEKMSTNVLDCSRSPIATPVSTVPSLRDSMHLTPLSSPMHLEAFPDLLWQAVSLADSLTSQLKSPMTPRTDELQ
ncbi:MAG TPA: circadian clock protein LdpA [Elainellaceae cyanobacterium]